MQYIEIMSVIAGILKIRYSIHVVVPTPGRGMRCRHRSYHCFLVAVEDDVACHIR